jgi:hypothetical protein
MTMEQRITEALLPITGQIPMPPVKLQRLPFEWLVAQLTLAQESDECGSWWFSLSGDAKAAIVCSVPVCEGTIDQHLRRCRIAVESVQRIAS